MKKRNSIGPLAALTGAMLIYGTIGLFRRGLTMPSGFLAMSRGFIGMFSLLLFLSVTGRKLSPGAVKKSLVPLLVSGAMIGFNWILLFEAYRYTSVAAATLCYYMAPVLVIIASPFLLGEKLSVRKWLCVAAALAGMVLVSGVSSSGFTGGADGFHGILLGLGAAVLYAAVILLNKKLPPALPAYDRTIVQLGSAAVVLVPYTLLAERGAEAVFDAKSVILLILLGVVHTGIAYALYFSSIGSLRAQTVALFSYIDPITAILWSALFLHEPLTLRSGLGAVLVLGSTLLCELEPSKNDH